MSNSLMQRNDSTYQNIFLTDDRLQNYDKDSLWDKLNLSQKYSVCSLGQFGYTLSYVRSIGTSTLAILKLDNKVATINEAGIINVNPEIACRS